MEELKAEAEALGIKIDGRWSEDRLREEIAKATPVTSPEATVPVRLTHDVWFEEGRRTRAGAVITVSVARARALIDAGKALRADPLPGETA